LLPLVTKYDFSLAELAADTRASTPSNAAEILVPDKTSEINKLDNAKKSLMYSLTEQLNNANDYLMHQSDKLTHSLNHKIDQQKRILNIKTELLEALNPSKILEKGYAIVYKNGAAQSSVNKLSTNDKINIRLNDGNISSTINEISEL
jgi:exodeoxyribonuclease VII large subunit